MTIDSFEVERRITKALREVCRRIGHDHGEWKNAQTYDGKPYRYRMCRTCGHEENLAPAIEGGDA